jgi:RNase P subunit RPR2
MTDSRTAKDGSRLPKSVCQNCGKPLDAAARPQADEPRPGPGDVTVCLGCGHIMVYADDMNLRHPTGEEMAEIAGDPEIIEAQRFSAHYRDVAKKESWT